MKIFFATIFLATLITVTYSRFVPPNQLIDRDETLDQDGKVRVKWHVDSVAEMVSFEVVAQATGWVGFGISKSGGMTGADIVIGGVDADGNKYFEDRFSPGPSGLPRIDDQQDWYLADATEAAGVTTLKFQRKFDTGDEDQDIVIENDGVMFIWALGATDKLEYHIGERGTFPVNILEGLIPEEPASTSTEREIPASTPDYDRIDFTRTEILSNSCEVTWTVYFRLEKIIFEVTGNTTGYVGFGISESNNMVNADLIIGGINNDETPYFADRYSTGYSTPREDISQDWEFLEAQETANSTYLRFIRSFNTYDTEEDIEITYRNIYFIWGLGSSDDIEKHGVSGYKRVNILDSNIPQNFNRTEQIGEKITVTWSVNFITRKVVFEVLANATGYVGFGISPDGGMHGADLVIGGVSSDLTPYFDDRYFDKFGEPVIDEEQNWILLAVREQKNQTYLRFIRDFDTGDAIQDLRIEDEDTNFIWALGSTDDVEQHYDRGTFAVNILSAF